MGKTRQSGNLVSNNNIFVRTSNNSVGIGTTNAQYTLDVRGDINLTGTFRQNGSQFVSSRWTSGTGDDIYRLSGDVGIGTTNVRFPLEVGAVGAAGTQLWVNGNARVTGILSIGQGTVSIDGNSNQINVGAGITIHETNGIQVGQNIIRSSGLTLNSLNVTGIVTAAGGMSIGIQSAGVNIATGVVTAFNFVGTGNSITYNAGTKTVDIRISGGGGAAAATSPTKFSEIFTANDSGFNGQLAYSAMARTAGGTKGNTFFIVRAEGSSTVTRFRVYPITVDRATGVITKGTPVNAWSNSSVGNNYSTTYFMGPDGTGAIFAGGNNAIPGYSSYQFSYFKFIVNANGTLSDSAQVFSSADHITNGTYMTLPTSINTGYIPSVGYQSSNSLAHYRLSTVSANSISVGPVTSLNSDTSGVYPAQMYSQPGVYQTGNQAIGFISYRVNSSTYYIRAFSASGSFSDHSVSTTDSQMYGFQMSTGDVILYCVGLGKIFRFTAFNSVIDITSTAVSNFFPTAVSGNYIYPHFSIGSDTFVFSLSSAYPFAFNTPLVRATLNSSTGFTVNGITTSDALTSVGYSNEYTSLFPLYANVNDAAPDKLLLFASSYNYFKAKVISMPTFTSI